MLNGQKYKLNSRVIYLEGTGRTETGWVEDEVLGWAGRVCNLQLGQER